MGLLEGDERQRLIAILLRLPHIGDPDLRAILVANLPNTLQNTISANRAAAVIFVPQLIDMVDGETWAQLLNKAWSVIFVVENALNMVRGAQIEEELQALLDTLKTRVRSRKPDRLPRSSGPQEPTPWPVQPNILLTPEQRTQLQEALLTTFARKSKLVQMVWETFDENLVILAGDTSPTVVALNLITWAEANDRIAELVNAIVAANPNSAGLQAIITAQAERE